LSTQLSQTAQWELLGGRWILQVSQNFNLTSTPLTATNLAALAPSSSDDGDAWLLGMIPGSLVAASSKLAVAYEQEWRCKS